MQNNQSKTESPTAVSSTPLVQRSGERPTGYLIWDDGKLMQQWEYTACTWYGYWHRKQETEWREVQTRKAPNGADQRPGRTGGSDCK